MPRDQQMLWMRDVDDLDPASFLWVEARLASETDVDGFMSYRDAVLCTRVTSSPGTDGLFKYVLRTKVPTSADHELEGTTKGYLFPGGALGELVAFLSLQLATRFYLLSTSLGELTGHSIPLATEFTIVRGEFGENIDPVLFGPPRRSFAGFAEFLDLIHNHLPPRHHLRIAIAAHHYARALREIGVDEEMAFVRMVSAVETAAGHEPADSLTERVLANLAKDGFSEQETREVQKALRTRAAKRKFIAFLQQYSSGFFDAEPTQPAHTQVTRENLEEVAGAIYDARSAYLHNGDPMYLSSIRIRNEGGWHMDPSVGMTWQDRRFKQKQKLPYVHFFHRLVRHCLREHIYGHIKRDSSPSP